MPAGWQFKDGALTRVAAGGDLISKDEFENFELELDWKISKGGNSGIMFHVVEDSTLETYMTGPEMQVLDNKGHHDGLEPKPSAGSDFALHAVARDVSKPAGQWNHVRLVVRNPHVEHWLNGVKVVEYDLWSKSWKDLVANSKFKQWPRFGLARKGHIVLQDHGDMVSYRNIRIRRLK